MKTLIESSMMDDGDGLISTVFLFSILVFLIVIITLFCRRWRQFVHRRNDGGPGGKVFIVVDEDGNNIGGRNFPAGGCLVGRRNSGGGFRYDGNVRIFE